MPWHQFWKRKNKEAESETESAATESLPPHMQQIIQDRKRPDGASPDLQTKLSRLERNRLASLYDIEQGELAIQAGNPWQQRIQLLTEAMATVQADLNETKLIRRSPSSPPPDVSIEAIGAEIEPIAAVRFTIGEETFLYEEELDWSERGHQLAQSELQRRSGDVSQVIPEDAAGSLRDPLVRHLDESLFVFASDMRDRALDQLSLPQAVSLKDLAKPCPVCGGWTDWLGRCQACRQREAALQDLKREENRLLTERGREAEEQYRLKERLPIARRRLRDLDADIETLRSQISRSM
ncbi:MAG: hypothetical protein WKF81_04435 [Thermomicrobiales bacterium]